jgi:hypothetical protein
MIDIIFPTKWSRMDVMEWFDDRLQFEIEYWIERENGQYICLCVLVD